MPISAYNVFLNGFVLFRFSQERRRGETRGQRVAGRVAARDHRGRGGGHVNQRQAAGRPHGRPGRGRRRRPGVRLLVHLPGTGAVRLQQRHEAGRSVGRGRLQLAAARTARPLVQAGVHLDRCLPPPPPPSPHHKVLARRLLFSFDRGRTTPFALWFPLAVSFPERTNNS